MSTTPVETREGTLPVATAGRSWRWVLAGLRERPGAAVAVPVAAVAAASAGLVAPWVLGRLVDAIAGGAGGDRAGAVVWAVAAIAAAAVATGALTGLARALVARTGERLLAELRERVVARVLRLPAQAVERAGTGDLVSRVGDDVAVAATAVTSIVPIVVTSLFTVGLTLVGLTALDWRLALAGAAALPVYWFALRWYLPRSGPRYAEERVAIGARTQALLSSVRGAATVHAYGVEREHAARVDTASRQARDVSIGVFAMVTRFAGWMNRAELLGLGLILATGFWLVRADVGVTVGMATAAALYFHRLFNPLGALLMTFDDLQSAGASLNRLVGVAELPEPAAGSAAPVPGAQGAPGTASVAPVALRVDGVSHRYDDGPEVLSGVALEVAAGERVALVGATGAGKSTLASIAAGELAPVGGGVRIGGRDLAAVGEDEARRLVVLVSQEAHVFAGTVLDDLRLADPDADEQRVAAALERVGALGWVRALPDGVRTAVGEGGHALTPAQAQHLALARLALTSAPVAVLDEATAEAGSAGARELEAAAAAATEGRTVLVVAHRLTQAVTADRVVVLHRGRVAEAGTHAELIAAGGRYARLWSAWRAGAE